MAAPDRPVQRAARTLRRTPTRGRPGAALTKHQRASFRPVPSPGLRGQRAAQQSRRDRALGRPQASWSRIPPECPRRSVSITALPASRQWWLEHVNGAHAGHDTSCLTSPSSTAPSAARPTSPRVRRRGHARRDRSREIDAKDQPSGCRAPRPVAGRSSTAKTASDPTSSWTTPTRATRAPTHRHSAYHRVNRADCGRGPC